ncbi:MAG: penicillin-binding protein 1C [Candidatus Riflebacteria bacterium]|nr:penicillin-binding protein 1C [Candidatus Riflebacteria bacterium]
MKAIKKIIKTLLIIFFFSVLVISFGIQYLYHFHTDDLSLQIKEKLLDWGALCSRDGQYLRLFPGYDGMFKITQKANFFKKPLFDAITAAEDKRFFSHKGIDPIAIMRAIKQMIMQRKVVSGASTITQQLIRIARPSPRSLSAKIREALEAIKLETVMSKNEILNAYLNLAPMGGNLQGAALASLIYFGKSADSLSPSETALLAAIPQSPTRLNPRTRKDLSVLQKRRDLILSRMLEMQMISSETFQLSIKVPILKPSGSFPLRAPHFCDWYVKRNGVPKGEVRTSIDFTKQKLLETSISSHRNRLSQSGAFQVCAMIADSKSLEVHAMTGSHSYNNKNYGFINGCDSKRSGGSILKPFLYALAIENGYYAGTSIADTKQDFRTPQGDYIPSNSTRKHHGPVSIRTALGNSLNIAAVKLLNEIGIKNFFEFLVEIGILTSDSKAIDRYGLGLAIGNPEISMIDIVQAYGVFTNGGQLVKLRDTPGEPLALKKLLQPESSYIILDILSDPSARMLTFGNPAFFAYEKPVAIKTGTSTNYRDCWLIAVTHEHIICLWAGNFDGKQTYGLSGAVACGPILKHLLDGLEDKKDASWYKTPSSLCEIPVCGISGGSPTAFCTTVARELISIHSPKPLQCEFHTRDSLFHELPVEYVEWIRERQETGLPDTFRLANNLQPINPFESGLIDTSSSSVYVDNSPVSQSQLKFSNSSDTSSDVIYVCSEDSLPAQGNMARIKILSPHNGDRFVITNGNENIIMLKALPDNPVPEVIWMVDGLDIARCPAPYTAFWRLTRGRHSITCLGTAEESAQVTIEVE